MSPYFAGFKKEHVLSLFKNRHYTFKMLFEPNNSKLRKAKLCFADTMSHKFFFLFNESRIHGDIELVWLGFNVSPRSFCHELAKLTHQPLHDL